jgi:hypothetical protein
MGRRWRRLILALLAGNALILSKPCPSSSRLFSNKYEKKTIRDHYFPPT